MVTRRIPLGYCTLPKHLSLWPFFYGVRGVQSLVFCRMCYRPAALLPIVFWSLHCLSFYDLEFLIIRLVLSNFPIVTNIQLPLNVLVWLLRYCMCWVGELYVIIQVLSWFMTQLRMCNKSNTIGATSEARKTYHSGASSHWPFWSLLPLIILEHPPTDHSGAPFPSLVVFVLLSL